jgi:membrane protein
MNQVMSSRLADFGRRYLRAFRDDDVPGIGAELAFRFLFAVFPLGIFATALGALVAGMLGIDNPAEQAVRALGDNLPSGVASPLQHELQRVITQSGVGVLSFGALLALYSAAGGTNTLIKAMNRALDVEESRGFVGRLIVAVILTLLLAVGIIAAFVTIVGGALLTEQAAQQLGVGNTARTVIELLRWPAVFVVLVVAVSILFRFAPNVAAPWRWIVTGAAAFAVGWLIATFAFSLYVTSVANYSATYGALGGVVALMLWFYLTAIVLVGSAEVVAIGTKMTDPGRLAVPEQTTLDRVAEDASEATAEEAHEVADHARGAIGEGTDQTGRRDRRTNGERRTNGGDRRRGFDRRRRPEEHAA